MTSRSRLQHAHILPLSLLAFEEEISSFSHTLFCQLSWIACPERLAVQFSQRACNMFFWLLLEHGPRWLNVNAFYNLCSLCT